MKKVCALNGFLEVNITGHGPTESLLQHVIIMLRSTVNVKNTKIAFDHLSTCFRKHTVQIPDKKYNECEEIARFLV